MITIVIPDWLAELYFNRFTSPEDTDVISLQAHIVNMQKVMAIQEAVISLQEAGLDVEAIYEVPVGLDDADLE